MQVSSGKKITFLLRTLLSNSYKKSESPGTMTDCDKLPDNTSGPLLSPEHSDTREMTRSAPQSRFDHELQNKVLNMLNTDISQKEKEISGLDQQILQRKKELERVRADLGIIDSALVEKNKEFSQITIDVDKDKAAISKFFALKFGMGLEELHLTEPEIFAKIASDAYEKRHTQLEIEMKSLTIMHFFNFFKCLKEEIPKRNWNPRILLKDGNGKTTLIIHLNDLMIQLVTELHGSIPREDIQRYLQNRPWDISDAQSA